MPSLSNKVVIVSGADTSVGRALALGLAQKGADIVIVTDHPDEMSARKTLDAIENCGSHGLILRGNFHDPDFAEEVIEDSIARFGHIDLHVPASRIKLRRDSHAQSTPGLIHQ